MANKNRLVKLALAFSLLTLLFIWTGCGSSSASLAKVNGQDITKDQVDREVKFRFGSQTAGSPDSSQFKALEKQMVDILVDQAVINGEAGKMGVTASDDDINKAIDQQKQAAGGQDKFNSKLSDAGVSDDQLRDMMRDDVNFQHVYAQVTKNVPAVTDAEAQDYYNQNQQTFNSPETRKVRQIVVADQDTANKLKAQLDAGGDFAALAKQYSTDTTSKDKGGELGDLSVQNSGYPPEFVQAMTRLQAGQISDPVKTALGYQIIQVESITPGGLQPFDQVKDGIKQSLGLERQRQAFDKWMTDARGRYDISYSPGYEPATSTTSGSASATVAAGSQQTTTAQP